MFGIIWLITKEMLSFKNTKTEFKKNINFSLSIHCLYMSQTIDVEVASINYYIIIGKFNCSEPNSVVNLENQTSQSFV